MRRAKLAVGVGLAILGVAATAWALEEAWTTDKNAAGHHIKNLPASAGPTEPPRTQDVAPGACIPKSTGANTLPLVCTTANTDYVAPNFTLGGDLSGTPASANVIKLLETGGPTHLTLGAWPDGAFLQRSGSTAIGTTTIPGASVGLTAGAFGYGSASNTLTGDASNAHWDSTNMRAGFRTSAPAFQLHLVDQAGASDRGLAIGMHATAPSDATAPSIDIFRSRGTFASPTAVTNADYLSRLAWLAHDGTNYLQVGAIGAHVTNGATVGTGSIPTDVFVLVSSSGNAAQIDPYGGNNLLAARFNNSSHAMFGLNAQTTDPGYTVSVRSNLLVGGGGIVNSTTFGTTGTQFVGQPQLVFMVNSTEGFAGNFRFARSNGTNASPTVVVARDTLGAHRYYGYDGAAYTLARTVKSFVNFDGTVSAGVVPTDWAVFNGDGGGLPDLFVGTGGDVVAGSWSQGVGTGGYFRIVDAGGVPVTTPATLRISAAVGATTTAIPMAFDSTDGRLYGYFGGAWHYAPFNDGVVAGFVPTSRTVQGTAPIQIAGDNAAHDLSANRTFSLAYDNASLEVFGGGLRRAALTGDITAAAGSNATTLANIPNDTPAAGDLLATAIAAPGTPASGKARVYVDSTSKNIAVKNDAGTVNHGAQSFTASAHQFANALANDGSWTTAQPSYSDISGSVPAITALTGDVTATGPGSAVATLANIPNDVPMAGDVLATVIAAPSSPAAGKARIYVDSTSKNLAVKSDDGVVKHGVQTAAAVSHQFVTAISAAGSVALAQPVEGDIVNLTTDLAGLAPVGATYITQTPNATLTNEQALSSLASGVMQSVTGTGVVSTFAVGSGRIPFGSGTSGQITDSANLTFSAGGLNNTLSVVSSNTTSGGLYFQNSTGTGQAAVYVDNDRGGFASYGGILNGSSGNVLGNLFGASRADRVFVFADGANNAGLAVGTLNATSLTLGTNNTVRVTIASGGGVTIASLTNGLVKSTSGLLANATAGVDYQAPIVWPVACGTGASHCERFVTSPGGTGSTNPGGGLQVEYDFDNDHFAISDDASIAIHGTGSSGPASLNMAFLHIFAGSSVYKIQSAKTGTGTVHPLTVASTAGVTVDDYLLVNGASAPTNTSMVVGHTTNANRDHVQFFVGGGGAQDNTNTLFDIFPAGTTIGTGTNGHPHATARVRGFTLTGSGGPTPSEVTGLFVDAPTLSGVTAPLYAIHTGIGSVVVDDLNGGGYVGAESSTGKLQIVKPTAEFNYFVEVTTSSITTLNAADQWIATSAHDAFFGSTQVEYPLGQTVPTYARIEACIVGSNTISTGEVDICASRNGSSGINMLFTSASSGCQRTAATMSGSASDTVGIQLCQGSGIGGRQTATLTGTLRLAIKYRLSPYSTF